MVGADSYDISVLKTRIGIDGPMSTVPGGPGLGVDVDWDVIRAHACP
jgi:L-alanine-DL-glutamate epimerase-like enolase superfamily enzyme